MDRFPFSIFELGQEFDQVKRSLIYDAFFLAEKMHRGQKRYDGAPYIVHPLAVANILVLELGIRDVNLICASLLHDILEDTLATSELLESEFGEEITSLVEGVTKPIYSPPKEEDIPLLQRKHEARERYALQLDEHPDPRVPLLKLCDALDNMRTLHRCEHVKRLRTQEKTRKYYLPLLDVLEKRRHLFTKEVTYLRHALFLTFGLYY